MIALRIFLAVFCIIFGVVGLIYNIYNYYNNKKYKIYSFKGIICIADTKTIYNELLQSKQWYNKRLSILKRDNFKCTICGKEHPLHVHHKYYLKYENGVKVYPWEYKDSALITVCSDCHKELHKKVINVYYI